MVSFRRDFGRSMFNLREKVRLKIFHFPPRSSRPTIYNFPIANKSVYI